jgi:hypothetical protein
MAGGCDERVFDHENYQENLAIWNMYGSELAGDFGTKRCGRPVAWGGKCEEHKVERRKGGRGRRRGDREPQGPLVSPTWTKGRHVCWGLHGDQPPKVRDYCSMYCSICGGNFAVELPWDSPGEGKDGEQADTRA